MTRTRRTDRPRLRLRRVYRHDIFAAHHTAVTVSKQAVPNWGVGKETPSLLDHPRAAGARAGPMLSVGYNAGKSGGDRSQFSSCGNLFWWQGLCRQRKRWMSLDRTSPATPSGGGRVIGRHRSTGLSPVSAQAQCPWPDASPPPRDAGVTPCVLAYSICSSKHYSMWLILPMQ